MRTPCWSSRSPARCTPRARRRPAGRERRDHRRGDDRAAHARRRTGVRADRHVDLRRQAQGQQTAARRFGADDVCAPERIYIEGARITHSRRLVGHGNREMLLGGFDRVLDCVGSGTSIEQAITITRPRGRVVLVGMPGELENRPRRGLAARARDPRRLRLRARLPAGAGVRAELKPGRLIDRGWPLDAFAKALDQAPKAARRAGSRPSSDRRMSIAPTRMIERSKRRHPAADREACVVEVHENSPPTLFHSGETFRLERLPVGSRIVYPPPPLKGLIDVDAAITAALDSPLGMDPLDSLLSPGMKLTIAFDDISLPLPPMKTPDIRGRVIEHVLERAYRAGVEDIHLIAALGAAPPDDRGRAQARGRPADLRRVLSGPALQPRRRGPGRDRRARRDPPRRGGRALQAGRRVGPAGLREHQPGARWTAATSRSRSASAPTTASGRTTTSRRCATRSRSWTCTSPSCTTAPDARATTTAD